MRTILLLFLFTFFFETFSDAQVPSYELHRRIGVQVEFPQALSVDSEGNIYFSDYWLTKFSPEGKVFHNYKPEGIDQHKYGSFRITLDQHDNLYVLSYTYSKFAKYNKEGKLLFETGTEGRGTGQFRSPSDIKVNSQDEIFIADSGNGRIQRFSKDGAFLQEIPIVLNNVNQWYNTPTSIDLDAQGNLYALDASDKQIIKFSPEGEQLLVLGNKGAAETRINSPDRLAVDKTTGQVYVSDHRIDGSYSGFIVFGADGNYENRFALNEGPGRLSGTQHIIAVNHEGNILIADDRHQSDSQIILYDKNGQFLEKWGDQWNAREFTLDEEGNVFLLDFWGKITKFNPEGDVVMEFGKTGTAISTDIIGNIYVLNGSAISKFNSSGQFVERYNDFGSGAESHTFTDLAHDAAGNMYVTDRYDGVVRKLSPQGRFLRKIGSKGAGPGQLWIPLAVAVDMLGIIHVLDYNGGRIQQFDPDGNFIRQFGKYSSGDIGLVSDSDLAVDGKGNIYIASNTYKNYFWIYNNKGELLHEEERNISHISVDRSGSRLIVGEYLSNAYSIYLSPDYQEPQSMIKGYVFNDSKNNCTFDETGQAIPGIIIEATPGPVYAVTGADGSYKLKVDTGSYSLRSIIPEQAGMLIKPTCPLPEQAKTVVVKASGDVVDAINFGNRVTLSPHLSVSISSTRRRRCFESTTSVRYINSGFATAENAKVYVQLPAEVELLSADKAYTRLPDGTFEFAVGDLAAGQSGTITIQDKVKCGDESVRGRTVCTRAWITPTNNPPTKPIPTVTITGRCDAESGRIRFVIKNTGTADMEQHELFRKYVDGRLASKEQFRLAAGDSMVLWVPSMGYTWRLEADQPAGNGDNKIASVTIEACTAANAGTTVSSGLVNLMPTDDEEAEKSEECVMITDSYDPNDKLVTPVGRTAEHYTSTNTALKYKIRFQNTGTDMAYRVVVVDTLSEYLDLSTLQLGAASHDNRLEVSGKGRPVLTWTFDNIMLPDSNANEPGSHGYIQFSIKPKTGLPEKTAVENFADIFFDYNSPIRTNVTVNRIFDMPQVVDEAVRVNLEDVLATPAIAAFEPAAGKYGTEVTITGKRFASHATDNKVYLNSKAATVVSATASELRVLVPEGATTGNLKVITLDGGITTTEKFEVYQPPVLSTFSPAEGVVGQTVILQGKHLSIKKLPQVYLGEQLCEVSIAGSGELQVVVPAGAITGTFKVSTEGGEVQSTQTYRVWQQPAIMALSKRTDRAGSELRITGADFAEQAARNKVYFGQAQATVLQATAGFLLVEIPATAAAGKVKVITPGGEAFSDQTFELIPAPVLVQMQPAQGSVGTVVELRGQNFLISNKQDTVSFNGIKAVVLSASPELLKVQVPRGVSTGKVEIKGVGGAALSAQDFVVEDLTLAESVIISPNPSDGSFKLDLHRADFEATRLQVYSSLGQLVLEQSIATPLPDALQVRLPKIQGGIYLLQLHTDRGLLRYKLFVR